MMSILGLVLGIIAGSAVGFFLIQKLNAQKAQELMNRANSLGDVTVKEAKSTAERLLSEAQTKMSEANLKLNDANAKVQNLIDKAEIKNEQIKNQKIQEAREKFNVMKSEFETFKNKQTLEFKDREMEVVSKEAEFKNTYQVHLNQVEELKKQKSDVEQSKAETESIRENLNKQLLIIAKRKEDLDAANELRIRELERVSNLTEQEAKDHLLEAVRGKAENEAMIIMRESIANANANASKEAKKIVIQAIQRMSAEFAIENTVSVSILTAMK